MGWGTLGKPVGATVVKGDEVKVRPESNSVLEGRLASKGLDSLDLH